MVAIFLLLVYTCNGTSLQQLLNALILVEHFLEHQAIVEEISISEFLILHYLSGTPNDADHERDMQLPFKTLDFVASANIPVYIPAFFPELAFPPTLSLLVHKSVLNEHFRPTLYLSSIWQPPKSC